jgi:hypothetical protein
MLISRWCRIGGAQHTCNVSAQCGTAHLEALSLTLHTDAHNERAVPSIFMCFIAFTAHEQLACAGWAHSDGTTSFARPACDELAAPRTGQLLTQASAPTFCMRWTPDTKTSKMPQSDVFGGWDGGQKHLFRRIKASQDGTSSDL